MADKLPPLIYRPVFVKYVASRKCRFNPSYANAGRDAEDLWAAWEKRHPRRIRPDDSVSLKPVSRRKKK